MWYSVSMNEQKTAHRVTEAIDWASLAVTAGAIVTYIITSSALVALFFLVPVVAMRVAVLRMKTTTDNIWLLIGSLAVTLLLVIMAFGQ